MSLEQDSDALEAAARQDAWRHIRKFLGFKLCELDKSFELPNPMAQYANLAIGELPAVCRKEAAIWEKIQQRIVPAAEKMLRDKVLAPERIALYGPLLKVESEKPAPGMPWRYRGLLALSDDAKQVRGVHRKTGAAAFQIGTLQLCQRGLVRHARCEEFPGCHRFVCRFPREDSKNACRVRAASRVVPQTGLCSARARNDYAEGAG